MTTATASLPYPIGINLTVYRDDEEWDKYPRWFSRPSHQLAELFVARITLGHYRDEEGNTEPAYTYPEWCEKADQLLTEYPGCLFVYAGD